MKKAMMLFLIGVLLTGCTTLAPAPTPTTTLVPPTSSMSAVDVVKAYKTAFDRRDVSATMALLTDDVWLLESNDGGWALTREDVQAAHEFNFGVNTEVDYTDCQPSGNAVICKLNYSLECSRDFGIGIHGNALFKILDGKIQTIWWDFNSTDMTKFWESWNKFDPWWKTTYPDEYTMANNNWMTKENGALLAKRCKEYAATKK